MYVEMVIMITQIVNCVINVNPIALHALILINAKHAILPKIESLVLLLNNAYVTKDTLKIKLLFFA